MWELFNVRINVILNEILHSEAWGIEKWSEESETNKLVKSDWY